MKKPAVKKNPAPTPIYDPAKIEKKWQKKWRSADRAGGGSASGIYKSKEDSRKKKLYVLDMFPYPSGEGLHVGHPKGYIATDVVSRMKRMQGHSVLHPMGFDAFGLPAENYALKTKTHPEQAVKKNVIRYKKQLEMLGFDYDWSREINTTDPGYYKWTQWIFLQMFKKGLAYESYEPVNWCPTDKTVLANEDVENGRCERCGTPVEKKPMRQWVLKITDYADRLLKDLDAIDASELPHIIDRKNPPQKGKKSVERRTIHAIVRDPKTGKFLGLKWKNHPWTTFIVGGVEDGEDIIEAAKREVREETGYSDLKFVKFLGGPVKAEYYAAHKGENRVAITSGLYFELASDTHDAVASDEAGKHEPVWLDTSELNDEVMTCAELPVWLGPLDLPEELCFTDTQGRDAVKPELPFVERNAIMAIVKHWSEDKYIGLKWKKVDWQTLITGGPEGNQTPEEAAKAEIIEETGYLNPKLIRKVGRVHAKFFHVPKNVNRFAHFDIFYFELADSRRQEISEADKENHEVVWKTRQEMLNFLGAQAQRYAWARFMAQQFDSWSAPLLDWPESIKEAQRNWIGRSEGALIKFRIRTGKDADRKTELEVFTTRPDTIFGVTYLVMAPEHPLIRDFLPGLSNRTEVDAYISKAQKETEIERTDAKKEKTGVELKGVKAVNPANNQEVPVWIADYVLPDYGSGAIMAVPAHDERDFEFAKKFGLPVRQVIAPYYENTTDAPAKSDKKKVIRRNIHAIIRHPTEKKYLCIKWTSVNLNAQSFVTGGVENGEDPAVAAAREIREETGYKNFHRIKTPGSDFEVHSYFFAPHKDENRYMIASGVLFQLDDLERDDIGAEEKKKHDLIWIDEDKVRDFLSYENQKLVWDYCAGDSVPTGSGILINSGKSNGENSEEITKIITEAVGGAWVTKYKLRDWVFSRQRYWGEPIPLIHCENCGVVAVPEKDLPVKLPKVKSYEPTGTGESPLATIAKWVNVKCPECGGKGRRETNTMPQWAGSSWYHLRYEDPKNKKKLVDPQNEKYWSPVDLYVGGAEHATRHLIYARFWHKFLHDIGVVSTREPFKKLQHVGLIMGEDGRKMSKRYGNVVNPDNIVKAYGADALRMYEMFMGPFDQQISWNTESMSGTRRFIERVWKLASHVTPAKAGVQDRTRDLDVKTLDSRSSLPSTAIGGGNDTIDRAMHKAIKKVTDDILNFRFNTAVSTLMITVNELEKAETVSRSSFESLLKLLAPFAPHVTEELWMSLGNKQSIHISSWPVFDPELAVDEETTIIVQVNGKVRGSFKAPTGSPKEALLEQAKNLPEVRKWTEGKEIRKEIVVPERLVSLVV